MTARKAQSATVTDRGEFELNVGGMRMVMRPSYDAIGEFETETGKGLLELSRAALQGTLRLGEVAQIATICIRAWGREQKNSHAAAKADKVARLILESDGGLVTALQQVSAMLALAVTGGCTASGEIKPATMKTATAAPVAG